jgi:hypothetical protein
MWLVIALLCTTILFAIAFDWWALTLSLFVWATLSYWRSSHTTGYETMESLRALHVWQYVLPFVQHRIVDVESGMPLSTGERNSPAGAAGGGTSGRNIYVVLPNATNTVLVSGFGLHGGHFGSGMCYLMPDIFFWIPLVREFLLLTGAVASSGNRAEDTIARMTSLGKHVAYAPSGMRDALYAHEERNIHAQRPGMSLFRLACERGYSVVPCLALGENDSRYIFFTSERLRKIQRWFLERVGYPFPLLCCPDRKGARIDLWVGAPIASKGKDPEALQREFFIALEALNNTGADEKELILKD